MNRLFYLSHPQVQIDPAVPVPDWRLSDIGRARAARLAAAEWPRSATRIVSSAERKAVETATLLADAKGIEIEVRGCMGENNRSATGFLPPDEFEATADAFFSQPEQSIRGWERALDAQARIVAEAEAVLGGHAGGDILLVGHGAVGTLLWCHYAGLPIGRTHDQPAGGGNIWALEIGGRPLHPWKPLEDILP